MLAVLTTIVATEALASHVGYLLLVWVISGLAWEVKQLAAGDRRAYLADSFNRLDLLGLLFAFAALVSALAEAAMDVVVPMQALATLFLWLRLLRVLLPFPTFGPYVLMFFRMLRTDVFLNLANK